MTGKSPMQELKTSPALFPQKFQPLLPRFSVPNCWRVGGEQHVTCINAIFIPQFGPKCCPFSKPPMNVILQAKTPLLLAYAAYAQSAKQVFGS